MLLWLQNFLSTMSDLKMKAKKNTVNKNVAQGVEIRSGNCTLKLNFQFHFFFSNKIPENSSYVLVISTSLSASVILVVVVYVGVIFIPSTDSYNERFKVEINLKC